MTGSVRSFEESAKVIGGASDREARKAACTDNVRAAVWVRECKKQQTPVASSPTGSRSVLDRSHGPLSCLQNTVSQDS